MRKVAELKGRDLDRAVAAVLGKKGLDEFDLGAMGRGQLESLLVRAEIDPEDHWGSEEMREALICHPCPQFPLYSSDWASGGPVKEVFAIATRKHSGGTWYAMRSQELGDGERAQWCEFSWKSSSVNKQRVRFTGATELEAAMRCVVGHHFGETVDLSD